MQPHLSPCPIVSSLLDVLEEPLLDVQVNQTTIMMRADAAQTWLCQIYLGRWLELIGALPDCGFELALLNRAALRALGNMAADLQEPGDLGQQVFLIEGVTRSLKLVASRIRKHAPHERSFEWGLAARDVVAAARDGFLETDFLNPDILSQLAPACMYAAFLVSEILTDEGSAEEISEELFQRLPRKLVEQLVGLNPAPEA